MEMADKSVSKIRLFFAKSIFYIHLAFVIFFIFGWLLPKSFLLLHIISIPLVILQWRLNHDQCVLTQIQAKLEGVELDHSEEGTFVKDLFSRLGMEFSRGQLMMIIYGLLLLSGLVSCYRLWG